MKALLAIIAILLPVAALADGPQPVGPNNGQYGDWTAATYGTGDAKICYAFTKPESTKPPVPDRALAMLTVTARGAGQADISFTPGFTFPATAQVNLDVGHAKLPFYIQNNVAFAENTAQAMVGFARYSAAATSATGPDHIPHVDLWSLKGFSAAYKAIAAACP
jgi:hypothetical protein